MPRTPRRRSCWNRCPRERSAQGWRRPLEWLRRAGQFFLALSFSSLTRRIVSLNLAGLVALVACILYLSQFRAGLIDARAENLLSTGEVIAQAIAATGTTEANGLTIDPDRLLDLKPGDSYGPPDDALSGLDFPINPERIAPMLRGLIKPTKTRARIYDRDGVLILDSRSFPGRGDVMRFELAPPSTGTPGIIERAMIAARTWLNRGDLPLYRELGPENGKGYSEVARALDGNEGSMVRINDRGEVIVSVAVPVQHFRAVNGVAAAVDPGRRYRPDGHRGAAGDPEDLRGGGRRDDRAVAAAGEHHRRSRAPAGRQRRTCPPPHPDPRRDSRFHPPPRRDRTSVRRAARHDRRAL